MEHLRRASASDDLYSGYNDYPSAFSTKDLDQDEILQQALRTSYGRRPVVSRMIVV
jgi:intraflagellar transport protein 88